MEKGGYYDDSTEMTGLMIVVVTVGKIGVWIICSIPLYANEDILEKGGQLP